MTKATHEDGDEPKRCRAEKKQGGGRCGMPKVRGKEVCRLHGGLSTGRPPDHGRWAKPLGRFSEGWEAARMDEELLDMRNTIALLDVLVQRSAERLNDLDSRDFRKRVTEHVTEARMASDDTERDMALDEALSLCETGGEEDKALRALGEHVERLSKTQAEAWRIRLSAANAITFNDLKSIFVRLADIISQEVVDDDVGRRVLARIDSELLGSSPAVARSQAKRIVGG